MRVDRRGCIVIVLITLSAAAGPRAQPPLPMPVTNNATAIGPVGGRTWVFSLLGLDSTKRWSGITRAAYAWSPGMREWQRLPDVPGAVGRLAATAQVVRGKLYLFGGYTVDSVGGERSIDAVDVWDPERSRWEAGVPMTVAVDDAVSATWRDSLVYLISGWHNTDNVPLVQVFDVVERRWMQATPIPGPGVFGHTGALAGNTLVYLDGAVRVRGNARYGLHASSWAGDIDPQQPLRIAWRALPPHPGPAIYRAAASGCGDRVVITGGTDNPYNYNGIGYDGRPSQPRRFAFMWDTRRSRWTTAPAPPRATMDHRGLLMRGDTAVLVGGMTDGQSVSSEVVRWALPCSP